MDLFAYMTPLFISFEIVYVYLNNPPLIKKKKHVASNYNAAPPLAKGDFDPPGGPPPIGPSRRFFFRAPCKLKQCPFRH